MRRLWLLVVVTAAVLAGCGGGELKDKVVGVWKIDVTSVKGEKLSESESKEAERARMELKADSTVTLSGMGDTKTGKWTLSERNIQITMDKQEDQKGTPTLTVNEDGSRINATHRDMQLDFVKA